MAISTVKVNINGQNYDLTYNSSSGKWEATITAPSATSWDEPENKYGVTVTATDDAGNTTIKDRTDTVLGNSLKLRVLEKVKPTVTLSSPSSGARLTNAKPPITFQLRDSGSGIKIDTLALKIDSGTTITHNSSGMVATSVPGGYDCTYTPATALSNGAHTITIQIGDNDGNTSTLLSSSFTIDTIAPTLNVTAPSEGLRTNNANLNITGSTNDATSGPATVTISLNGADQGAVPVTSGNFSKSITLKEGANVIVVKAKDAAGLETTVTRNVTLDTIAPTISAVTLVPNPVDGGATFVITVMVAD